MNESGLLQPHEFDQSYFDGSLTRVTHNAGYSHYERWHRNDGEETAGEFWADFASVLCKRFNLRGKRVLEMGAAKGFVVEDLRAQGVDAWGVDVSEYAIGCANVSTRHYLIQSDAVSALSSMNPKEYDMLFSRAFLECLAVDYLSALVHVANKTAKQQVHFIHTNVNPKFYTAQSLEWWANLGWERSVLIAIEGGKEIET